MMNAIILLLRILGLTACCADVCLLICQEYKPWMRIKVEVKNLIKKLIKIGTSLGVGVSLLSNILDPGSPMIFPTSPAILPFGKIRIQGSQPFAHIFFTLDGTDPAISGTLYREEIVLQGANQFVTVTVRTYFLGAWSEPVSKTYYVSNQRNDVQNSAAKFCESRMSKALTVRLAEGAAL